MSSDVETVNDWYGEIVIEVHGRHFKYFRTTLLKDALAFDELHESLIKRGYWQGTQYSGPQDVFLTYFKYMGEV